MKNEKKLYLDSIGKNSVGQQEGVQKVNRKKPKKIISKMKD